MTEFSEAPPAHIIRRYYELTALLKYDTRDTPLAREYTQELTTLIFNWPCLTKMSVQQPSGATVPWNEAQLVSEFKSGARWNTFMSLCPRTGDFEKEVESIVRYLRVEFDNMQLHKSQYGERFLVEWAVHSMPDPAAFFLKLTLELVEPPAHLWTIRMFEQHLTLWTKLFNSAAAHRYAADLVHKGAGNGAVPDHILRGNQRVTGGGWVADVLFRAGADPQRWAFQLWKSQWDMYWKSWSARLYDEDCTMTGM